MKQIILSTICLLYFFEMNAQHKINKEVLQFITKQYDTVAIYPGDIKIVDDFRFELVDSNKLDKLKGAAIDKAYFICDTCERKEVFFMGIFSSARPKSDLYILSLNNKVHLFRGAVVRCSKELLKKIKDIALPE